MSLENGGDDFVFTGVNVHVRSGSGATDGDASGFGNGSPTVNALGNLIVGYDELRGGGMDDKTGSHNLVVGPRHNYPSYGGLVAACYNSVLGPYASVSGGSENTASGDYASVSGGRYNDANYLNTSVSGGYSNTASGNYASVSGGQSNVASGNRASVSGGLDNTATI
ncbi:MAG: hypothetical protein ACYSU0_20820, partial [Planctomycetota bacterium]